ncbi:MAG: DotD/TraH family lipoprotein, partial [Alphaproteobacteria bacterium]|nr:DotD/TraH family lipoprotein [Alphaproteobacteria bacterium]
RSQMQLRIRGSQPPVPLTVTVDVYQKPVIEVFRDIGLQVGQRADLSVDGQGGTVEISYAPVDKI